MVQHGAPDLAAGCSEGGIPVGARVRCGGRFATVRWVGELRGRAGEWCGLEWDEPGQGKHNGAVDNYQYFTCSSSAPDCASFVRPQKLDAQVTCAQAIFAYYGEKEDESTAALHKAVIDEWKRKIKVPFIEMVGFESVQKKQGSLNTLLEACVSDKCISSSGDLESLCPNLRILDVSKNLLVDWYSVVEITSQLPHLMNLNLSKNRLLTPSSDKEADTLKPNFDGLQKINVAYCDIEWDAFMRICRMWRNIEEITSAYNRISIITQPSPNTFSEKLTTLVLDGNPLNSWKEILNLGKLKSLTDLSVNDCKLEYISFDDTYRGEKTDLFAKLEELHVKENLINDWRSISELNKLKKLSKLYIAKNPLLLLENYDTTSQLIIARIEHLKELNGSEVNREIRRGAEYDYLKKHGLLWKQSIDSNDENLVKEFGLFHSRFDQLILKYGLPDENLLTNKKENWAIRTKLIEVILKDDSTGLTMKKKVPITMSVQKLIALTRRMFSPKVSAARTSTCPKLSCVQMNKQQKAVLVPLDNQMKELDFFSVSDGDTIIVKW